ncbi:unnamed protein product [Ectocarpus sp. CCAP 1310/34]|nr:unnamed protein product [Ectocarpus sp. CCAP 1310/34]
MLGLACPGNGLSLRMIVTIDGSHHPGADGCWNRVAHSRLFGVPRRTIPERNTM